ncbi:hypothetical protein ACE3NQ_00430 [Paenibacillus terreus]|uniref:Uncharacterized protein n=1 Tax=Paenibacillus terreus TaxID=1387834 RepID=A0ABV5B3B7_9BACL
MADKLPAQGPGRLSRRPIPFRSPAAGEEAALPPEFAFPHDTEPSVQVAGSHVNWEQVTGAEAEEGSAASVMLDIDRMMKDDE